ncbi:MAG: extracellular solute-binding protein [Actinobacteria bacterium]|nr:extracellular solute-binding protein [Actinomycetota bacterium]
MLLTSLIVLQSTPASASYELLQGDGSTWSQTIINQWIADVQPMGMSVVYSGGGSSVGRSDFGNNQNDFAVSEIPFQGTDPVTGESDASPNRPYAYLPIVAGGTAFTYHLEQGGQLMRDVRLSGATIAKIFTNQIKNWNDPTIQADNNGRSFPDLPIHPVVRSDGSGTTAQFTRWLSNQYSADWSGFCGQRGLTSYYPTDCNNSDSRMIGQAGSDGVMNKITSTAGNGTIGYIEYSYALNANYPVVKVLNAAGYFVEPTAYNVAVALTSAEISPVDLTQNLDKVYTNADPRTYPLSSYSYMIMPTSKDDGKLNSTAKRQTFVDFMSYALCTGQQQAAPYGYSPMPLNLVQAAIAQVVRLGAIDSNVNISSTDVTQCGNPTFTAGDITANCLAGIAPIPFDSDKVGNGPNLTGSNTTTTGSCVNSTKVSTSVSGTQAGTTTGAGPNSSGTSPGASGGPTSPGGAASSQIDPETGLPVGGGSTDGSSSGTTGAVATTIAARPAGSTGVFAALSAAELIALAVVPGAVMVNRRRKSDRGDQQ